MPAVCEVLASSIPGTSEQEWNLGSLGVQWLSSWSHFAESYLQAQKIISHSSPYGTTDFSKGAIVFEKSKTLTKFPNLFFLFLLSWFPWLHFTDPFYIVNVNGFYWKTLCRISEGRKREMFTLIGKLCADFHNSVWDWVGHKWGIH